MTRRVEGWDVLFCEAVEKARKKKFCWGTHDCATWSFDIRAILTGEDATVSWKGQYTTEIGAAKMLRKLKCENVEDLAVSILGEPLRSVLFVQRGDIMLGGIENALGVCIGSHGLFLLPSGWTSIEIKSCLKAWRV